MRRRWRAAALCSAPMARSTDEKALNHKALNRNDDVQAAFCAEIHIFRCIVHPDSLMLVFAKLMA